MTILNQTDAQKADVPPATATGLRVRLENPNGSPAGRILLSGVLPHGDSTTLTEAADGTLTVVGQAPTPVSAGVTLGSLALLLADGTYLTGSQLQALLVPAGSTASPTPTPTPSPTPAPTPTPTPPAGPANTLTFGFYSGFPGSFNLSSNYGGYNYGTPVQYFTLSSSGGQVSTSASGVVVGYGTSPTTPPGPADHVVSGTINSNGYFAAPAHNGDYFDGNQIFVALPAGSAPSPGVARYLWASTDNGSTWSVHRNGSNAALPIMVTA